nr:RNB domain-containing ribonuclease [Burkholderiaceae bacterium]
LESGTIRIEPRRRGSVLDLIVSELMILANAHWGAWLAQHKVAGVYRSQTYLRGVSQVRMSTTPAPHEGMGLAQYAWASSPLRRYVDLVNQRQLIALVQGRPPAYGLKDAELFALIANFEMVYAAYGEFQSRLERYWCLRWLAQEKKTRVGAMALKGDVIKLDALPWVQRVAGLPELARGQVLELDVLGWDEVELSAHLRVHRVLPVADHGDAMVPTETPDVQEAAPTCADAVIAQDLLADDTKRVG